MTERWRRAGSMCFPACDDRAAHQAEGRFFYSSQLNAFVFTSEESPLRRMDFSAKVRMERHLKGEGDYSDHTDEPFRWETCPFCGGDLPIGGASIFLPPPPDEANPEE